MKKFYNKRLTRVFKLVFIGLTIMILAAPVSAAPVDWTGATSSDWATGSNWSSGSVPASADAVRIGVIGFTNQPVISDARSCASLTFGVIRSIILTVNTVSASPLTGLTITGDIVQNPDALALPAGFSTTLAGSGFISCSNLQVGNTITSDVLSTNNLIVIAKITSLSVSTNLNVYSNDISVAGVGAGINNAAFSLQGGTTNIGGQLLTFNTKLGAVPLAGNASPAFSIDIPAGSALTPVLTLANASPVNSASVAGSIDFYNNTGGTGTSTVYYNGVNQTVYTSTTAALNTSPQIYQYLLLTGTGTKTVGATSGGTLTVGQNLTSTTGAVQFNTNNPTVTIAGNWTNSSIATQATGDITVSGSVTNNSGGTLKLGSANFYIGANYTNNAGGTYTQGTGTTFFNGAGSQALVDNSSTGTVFKKVTFQGAATATMMTGAGNFSVSATGVLTMVSPAKLVAGSSAAAYLTLLSDTTGSATVSAIPPASSITGYVTVQRFVQGNPNYDVVKQRWVGRNYRLMSSPVNEGADANTSFPCSLNYLAANTIITDCTSTYGTTGGNPSLYLYNELYTPNNSSFTSGNFIGVTNVSSTTANSSIRTTDTTVHEPKIYAGEGFMMYFRGDNVTHITGSPSKTVYPYVAPESVVFSATGNLNQGTDSVRSWTGLRGLMFTTSNYPNNAAVQGFNLVGNPYPSSIDWSTFSNSDSSAPICGVNVDPTIYILNPTTNNYDTYHAGGSATGSASKIIPVGQGFLVHANNASPTLTFKEAAKTNTEVTGSNLLLGTPAQSVAAKQLLRLKLVTDSLNNDDIVIAFDPNASVNYNSNEDSEYFPGINSEEGLASISADNIKLSINSLPLPKQTPLTIKLDVEARASGAYTLQRSQLDSIPAVYELWLMDGYKKDSLDIRNNTTYAFDIDLTDTASYGSNRFKVIVRQAPALRLQLVSFAASKAQSGAEMVWKTKNEQSNTNFTIERSTDKGITFNVLGGFTSNNLGTYSFTDKNPLIGNDAYRLKLEDMNETVTYSNVVTLTYGSLNTMAGSNISVYPNPASDIINLAINQTGGDQTGGNQINGLSTLQNAARSLSLDALPAGGTPTSYNIRIINVTGSVIKMAVSSQSAWHDNISDFSPGTYVIQVENSDSKAVIGKSVFTKL